MSFFGALFAGVTLLSKGISKGQDIAEDRELKKRSQQLGKETYYDHKGVMHDAATGRAITYHTDPVTGHRLIQDAYTLNTIRDLTAEERFEEVKENKRKAEENGELFYEAGDLETYGYIQYKTWKEKYNWSYKGTMYEKGKEKWNSKDCYFAIENFRYEYHKNSYPYAKIYKKVGLVETYIKEKYDEFTVYTDLKNGLIVDADEKTKKELMKKKIKWEAYKETINNAKMKQRKVPICLY